MAIAGYGSISATSFMLNANSIYNNALREKPQAPDKTSRKIFIPVFINKFRIVGCVDSGSDVTILQYSRFKSIFHTNLGLHESDISHITTFCDNNIPILGIKNVFVCLKRDTPGIKLKMYIINDIPNVPTLLLGNDLLKTGLGTIAYTGAINDPIPEVRFLFPVEINCTVYYEVPSELSLCYATCHLEPYETREVDFYLPSGAPVLRTDSILITEQSWDTLAIIPSKSDIEYIQTLDRYVSTGCVVNTSSNHIKCKIIGKYELINDCDVVELHDYNIPQLRQKLIQAPLGREILMSRQTYLAQPPDSTTCNLTLSEQDTYQLSDLDYANTLGSKEPTFSGEATFEPEIIEPNGIDLPTIIYKDASEAIDLTLYSEELRPYIKEIFIDKYPQVVALHALDAGNLSLTLGFTQLRLREGEQLPRSKRIFHISQTDQRHLDDLCDFLIRFGYIMRSPMTPNGCHLYGMSAYLVPRSKANCLGRLIIDYSPVNQLIQSPSSVIPEINATIQFLQGKALYTSLDLKYAYLSLKIDQESQKLTTFITPTGSFQWLSLPTGAANSPAYFTDACNRMLHYEPEYDQDGNLIYEANNVVKQRRSVLTEVCNYFDDILITSTLKPTFKETLDAHFKNVEKTVKRMAFHGAKISVMKCDFAKSKILFLGWYISHDVVIADPRRIQKVKEFKFPNSKKAVRAFFRPCKLVKESYNIKCY